MAGVEIPSSDRAVDEIDLCELWRIARARKYLILITTTLFGLVSFFYATFHPGRPDQQVVKALVDIGRYSTQTGDIRTYESADDLAAILKEKMTIKVSVPRGAQSVLQLSASHSDRLTAKRQCEEALELIRDRHQMFADKLPESQRIVMSGPVAGLTYTVVSIKHSRALVTAIAVFVGAIIGLLAACSAEHNSRRQR